MIIVFKYDRDEWGWGPKYIRGYRRSMCWGCYFLCWGESNVKVVKSLKKMVVFRVGLRLPIRFWLDDWVGVRSSESLFLKLFRIMSNNQPSLWKCYSFNRGVVFWRVLIRRVLRQLKEFEYESLLSLFLRIFFRDDARIYKPSSLGSFQLILFLHFGVFSSLLRRKKERENFLWFGLFVSRFICGSFVENREMGFRAKGVCSS